MRWLPASLQTRMLLISLLATFVALALAGWAIAGVLERFVIDGLDRRLDAKITLLATAVDGEGHVDRTLLAQRVGALEGDHGWRWRIAAPGATVGSADFPQLDPGPSRPPHHEHLDSPGERLHPLEGEMEDGVRIHARQLTLRTRSGRVVLTAAAPREVVQRPVRAALLPLLAALGALALLLGASSVLQLRWGLQPLRRLRDQVAAIRVGARDGVDEDQPTELRGLAIELNQLAADNVAALATARWTAANLAHALKTPLATLGLTLRDQPGPAAQVARIDETIRHHLARARSEAVRRRTSTPLAPAVLDLVTAVRRLYAERDLSIETDVADNLAVAVDSHDLDELVGNLLDNAARHAASRLEVRAGPVREDLRLVMLSVVDDGPGIPAADLAMVAQPGVRLDERGDGHGFGLAIVQDLAQSYGGALKFEAAPGSGLMARLILPGASPLHSSASVGP